jgi:hypothetical protein
MFGKWFKLLLIQINTHLEPVKVNQSNALDEN